MRTDRSLLTAVPKFRVISRSTDLQRCTVSRTMSSGFSLKSMSFLQNDPNMLVRGLRRLFMSARLRPAVAEPFRHGDVTHAPLSGLLISIASTTWLSTPMLSYASRALDCQRPTRHQTSLMS